MSLEEEAEWLRKSFGDMPLLVEGLRKYRLLSNPVSWLCRMERSECSKDSMPALYGICQVFLRERSIQSQRNGIGDFG